MYFLYAVVCSRITNNLFHLPTCAATSEKCWIIVSPHKSFSLLGSVWYLRHRSGNAPHSTVIYLYLDHCTICTPLKWEICPHDYTDTTIKEAGLSVTNLYVNGTIEKREQAHWYHCNFIFFTELVPIIFIFCIAESYLMHKSFESWLQIHFQANGCDCTNRFLICMLKMRLWWTGHGA